MDKNELKSVNGSTIVMYTNEDGVTNLDVRLENETVWLSVEQMTILFGRDRTVITRHINKIFKEGELDETLVCAKFAHTKEYGRRKGFLQNQKILSMAKMGTNALQTIHW